MTNPLPCSAHMPRLPCLQGVRMIVTLECTEARAEGNTPSRYTTQKVCYSSSSDQRASRGGTQARAAAVPGAAVGRCQPEPVASWRAHLSGALVVPCSPLCPAPLACRTRRTPPSAWS